MLAARLLGAGRRWKGALRPSALLAAAPGRWAATGAEGVGDVELATEDERESMHFDVCIVGAGPAGLSAAIRFRQLCAEKGRDYSVCVLEKAAELGGHSLSGNVFQPTALNELLPGWSDDPDCPVKLPAARDRFYFFTAGRALRLPTPPPMKNKGNYVISLRWVERGGGGGRGGRGGRGGCRSAACAALRCSPALSPQRHRPCSELVRWLGRQAEAAGAEVFPGFAASKVVFHHDGGVGGVQTNDVGVARDGSRKENFTLGMALTARATLFAEGCRGSLSQVRGRLCFGTPAPWGWPLCLQLRGSHACVWPPQSAGGDQALWSGRGRCAADLRAGHQGGVGSGPRQARPRHRLALGRIPAALGRLRRVVALPHGGQQGLAGVRAREV